ncbi:DUF2986 domain-containing protein [Shewanella sp. SHSM-M6]|uniref:DUF2986 domain-containing protein n=2 Tax=Shewanella salipaludis TaxID=2723052 RepID=A0A972FU27_9GAMM|nr:DUF2986 domain-containing protein [Shewanella salipaludis]NMH66190.1 DUF2986 domain-containing protein [Shewanella salipaludis]
MNRKKKINDTLKSKAKKANAKLHSSNKPKYISKAERAKLELDAGVAEAGVEAPLPDSESESEPVPAPPHLTMPSGSSGWPGQA